MEIPHPDWKHVRLPDASAHARPQLSFDSQLLAFATASSLQVHFAKNHFPCITLTANAGSSTEAEEEPVLIQFGWLCDDYNQDSPVLVLASNAELNLSATTHASDLFRIIDLSLLIQVKSSQLLLSGDEASVLYALLNNNNGNNAELARFEFNARGELQIKQYWGLDSLEEDEGSFCVTQRALYSLSAGNEVHRRELYPSSEQSGRSTIVLTPALLEGKTFTDMTSMDGIRFLFSNKEEKCSYEFNLLTKTLVRGDAIRTLVKGGDIQPLHVVDQRICFPSSSITHALCNTTQTFAQEICLANGWEYELGALDLHRFEFALRNGDDSLAVRSLDNLARMDKHSLQVAQLVLELGPNLQQRVLAKHLERYLHDALLAKGQEDESTSVVYSRALALVRNARRQAPLISSPSAHGIDLFDLVKRSIPAHLWNRWSLLPSNEQIALDVLEFPSHIGSVCTFIQAREFNKPGHGGDVLAFVIHAVKQRAYQLLLLFEFDRAKSVLIKVGVDEQRFFRSVAEQTLNRGLRRRILRHLRLCTNEMKGEGEQLMDSRGEEEQFLLEMEALYPGKSHLLALRRYWASDGALVNCQLEASVGWRAKFNTNNAFLYSIGGESAQSATHFLQAPGTDEREGEYDEDVVVKTSATQCASCCCAQEEEEEPAPSAERAGFFQLSLDMAARCDAETKWRVKVEASSSGGPTSQIDVLADPAKAVWALHYLADYNDWRGLEAWRERYGDTNEFKAALASSSCFLQDLFAPVAAAAVEKEALQRNRLVDCQDLLFPGSFPPANLCELVLAELGCNTVEEAKPLLGSKPFLALQLLQPATHLLDADMASFPLLRKALAVTYIAASAEEENMDDAMVQQLARSLFGLRRPTLKATQEHLQVDMVVLDAGFYIAHHRPYAACAAILASKQDASVVRAACLANVGDSRVLQTAIKTLTLLSCDESIRELQVDFELLSLLFQHAATESERCDLQQCFQHGGDGLRLVLTRYAHLIRAAATSNALDDLFCEFIQLHQLAPSPSSTLCGALRLGDWQSLAMAPLDANKVALALLAPQGLLDMQMVWKNWLTVMLRLGPDQNTTLHEAISSCLEQAQAHQALARSARAFHTCFPALCEFIHFCLALEGGEEENQPDFLGQAMSEGEHAFMLAELGKLWERLGQVPDGRSRRAAVLHAILSLVRQSDKPGFAQEFVAQTLLAAAEEKRSFSLAYEITRELAVEAGEEEQMLRLAEQEFQRSGRSDFNLPLFASKAEWARAPERWLLAMRCALASHSKQRCREVFEAGLRLAGEWPLDQALLHCIARGGDLLPLEMHRALFARCSQAIDLQQDAAQLLIQHRHDVSIKVRQRCLAFACELAWETAIVMELGTKLGLYRELAAHLKRRKDSHALRDLITSLEARNGEYLDG